MANIRSSETLEQLHSRIAATLEASKLIEKFHLPHHLMGSLDQIADRIIEGQELQASRLCSEFLEGARLVTASFFKNAVIKRFSPALDDFMNRGYDEQILGELRVLINKMQFAVENETNGTAVVRTTAYNTILEYLRSVDERNAAILTEKERAHVEAVKARRLALANNFRSLRT